MPLLEVADYQSAEGMVDDYVCIVSRPAEKQPSKFEIGRLVCVERRARKA